MSVVSIIMKNVQLLTRLQFDGRSCQDGLKSSDQLSFPSGPHSKVERCLCAKGSRLWDLTICTKKKIRENPDTGNW